MSLASQVILLAQRIGTEFKNRDAGYLAQRGDYTGDLNAITKPGTYRLQGNFNTANHGSSSAYNYGTLIHFTSGAGIIQQYFEDGAARRMYWRESFGGSFGTSSTWYASTGTTVS